MDNPYVVSNVPVRRRVRLVAVSSNPIDVVNTRTGQVESATPYIGKRTWRDVEEFTKVYPSDEIYELSINALRVMFYVWTVMDFDGMFVFSADECAEKIGVKKRQVFNGLRELRDRDIVRRDRGCRYWFNPNIAYRGNRDDLLR